jgi:surfeit locus 1 family protein
MILMGSADPAKASGPVYRSFRPSLAVTLATAATVALTVTLGHWQQRRAEEKISLARAFDERMAGPVLSLPAAPVDAAELQFHRIRVHGQYAPELSFLLDNKVLDGVVGYLVMTPLRIEGGNEYVLVNRGWVAAGPRRDVLPALATPRGTLTVEGIATVPSKRFLQLGADAPGPVRENLVIDQLAAQQHIALQPIVLQQTLDAPDGLVRKPERPDIGADRNRAYSLQWYSLAALAAFLYVLLNFKRTDSRR